MTTWKEDAYRQTLEATDEGLTQALRRLDTLALAATAMRDAVLVASIKSAREHLTSLRTSQRQQLALIDNGAARPACAPVCDCVDCIDDSSDDALPPRADRSGAPEEAAVNPPSVASSAGAFPTGGAA